MSQKKTSVKVPLDLMEVVTTFHRIRKSVHEAMAVMQQEADLFNKGIKDRGARLDSKYTNACNVIRDALLEAKIITETQVFTVDSTYLEDHGEVYIRIEGDDIAPTPQRTVH